MRAAHTEYGEALGITKTPDEPNAGANLRDALTAFLLALRTYVVRVSAHVDEEDANSAELAALLLAPLTRWETLRNSGGQANEADVAASSSDGAQDKVEG